MKSLLLPSASRSRFTHFLLSAVALVSVSAAAFGQSSGIATLTTDNPSIIEHNFATSDDRGGIALSSSKVFYTGDNNTAIFDLANLANGGPVDNSTQFNALASNIRTRQVYTLADNDGITPNGGGVVTKLIALDSASGALTGTEIVLSTPVIITSDFWLAGIFSGWDRIVLVDGSTLNGYNIDLPSGNVTNLGNINLPNDQGINSRCGCENWATWGVAEFTGGTIKLAYVESPSSFEVRGGGGSSIKRYDVSTGASTPVAEFPGGLSDMCSFTVDPTQNRWYFHYESYSGAFSFGNDENIGYADATFLSPSAASVSLSGRVMTRDERGIANVRVTLQDADGTMRHATTGSFGYYSFAGVAAGESYVVSVSAKRFVFNTSSQSVTLNDNLSDLNFTAR